MELIAVGYHDQLMVDRNLYSIASFAVSSLHSPSIVAARTVKQVAHLSVQACDLDAGNCIYNRTAHGNKRNAGRQAVKHCLQITL